MSADPEPAGDAWPPRPPATGMAPVLSVEGFEGPLDWLLEMAQARRIDLARLSIGALIDAFAAAMDAALAGCAGRRAEDLGRWGDWLVMAATLALLRSRLLLPPDAPEARSAMEEAEVLRRRLLLRARMRAAATWLDQRAVLGRDVFARAAPEAGASARAADITELLRACLVALAMPDAEPDIYRPRGRPFWRVADAVARIEGVLAIRPGGGPLSGFVPEAEGAAGRDAPRRRAAVASTLMAALELARRGVLTVDQPVPFGPIHLRRREGDAAAPAGPGEPADRPVAGRRKNRAND